MEQDEHGDTDGADHGDVEEVRHHGHQCARQQVRFHEAMGLLRVEGIVAQAGQEQREGEGNAGIEPLLECLYGARLEHAKRGHAGQGTGHEEGQREDHARLHGEGERADQFLNGNGYAEEEKSDADGIGRNDAQHLSLSLQKEADVR